MGLAASLIRKTSIGMRPVTFILGATGTGKSDLAVALAKRFNGEIINADAMQLYQGLDIVTNKVTVEEQDGIPHHLLSILTPDSLSYTIHDYKREASAIIDRLLLEGKLPIIVGGTNYYADSLMWESLILRHEDELKPSSRFHPEDETPNQQTLAFLNETNVGSDSAVAEDTPLELSHLSQNELLDLTKSLDTNYLRLHIGRVDSPRLHSLLMHVDKDTARATHPNQPRKIIRALEVLKQHGKLQSEFVSEMNKKSGKQSFGAQLTYTNSLVIWLQCEQKVLEERLNNRVDKMIARGLIQELESFHVSHNSPLLNQPAEANHNDYTRGIFQCIGFKEFHSYLIMSEDERLSPSGIKCLADGISNMQIATRRYAKYQNRWVRKQLFELRNPEVVPPVYSFDSTDAGNFLCKVVEPAITLLGELEEGRIPTQPKHTMALKARESNEVVYETCEACGVICVRRSEWQAHITSRKHHKRLASIKKAQQRLAAAHSELSSTLTQHEAQLREGVVSPPLNSNKDEEFGVP